MATQNYTKPATYTTPDGKHTAELDYQGQTLTIHRGPRTLAVIAMSFERLDAISMRELKEICESTPEPADETVATEETTTQHVCDEDAERSMYRRYVDDGIGATDGYFAPESFAAWQGHYHRGIGHFESRTQACTATDCHAPSHEQVKMIQHIGLKPRAGGGQRRGVVRNETLCVPCYTARHTA